MARRVWEGLKSGPYYNTKGKRTSNQIMDTYAPPSENNTALYKQQNDQRMRAMLGGAYNPNTNIFAPGIGGQGGDAVIPARGPKRTAQGAGGGGAAAAPGLAAGGLAGSLQLNPQTAQLIRNWMVKTDAQLSRGIIPTTDKAWNGVLRGLQASAPIAGTGGGGPGSAIEAGASMLGAPSKKQAVAGTPGISPKGGSKFITAFNAGRPHVNKTPYSWGGGTPSGPSRGFAQGAPYVGFDCSSFVQFMAAKAGIKLPRTTGPQSKTGRAVNAKNPASWMPGDLIFPHAGHVQMYIGKGKIIEAPSTGKKIRITDVRSGTPYAVRRIF
jgi:cell wall-associated NlpC family hydrolase